MADGVDLSRKFVSESELDERRKKRQEEWEKVRKPDDPEEAPEEVYDPRSLFERLQEQKDKKQEEFEEQFKFKNMVRGLDEDETSFLDEVSRQQSLVEKRRRDEEKLELQEYRSAIAKHSASETRREPEKKTTSKQSAGEQRTSHLSQAHLLAGAVKRRSSSQSSDSSKKQKVENASSTTTGMGDAHTEQERGSPGEARGAERPQGPTSRAPSAPQGAPRGVVHLPSAAVCVGVLPGLCNYSGSSDSDSSSDSEGSVDVIMSPYPRQTRAYR
ncbi:PSME3-interacting protein isoform X1 [Boleophthalmus pectinirostris]|uniref:PSME3-interacting protein isoform X1 n=1 Tax=Boleophthalmus pectinirostris TaxID=150288 RepID=UPI000A1C40C2|nr:PSME3-interacting protein isoform X1 [Boleophthalmus pectinirostris]